MKKLFVMLAAIAFVVAFTAPSFAAEWSFYGSARMSTFWADRDFGDGTAPGGDDSDLDLAHGLQGNSRIGAKVKVSDNLSGRFEYGSTPNLRLLYGEYDFGGWKLGVGQNYQPLCMFYSSSAFGPDNNFLDVGGVYTGRDPAVWAKFGGLTVSLLQANTSTTPSAVDTDSTTPQIQVGYKFKIAGLSLAVAGGYQTYDVVDAADNDEDVSAYMIAIGASYNMGPLYLGGDYWMGQNTGNIGQATFGFAPNLVASDDGTDVLDNDSYGFLAVIGFTLSDMVRFEAGYGYVQADLDDASDEDETSGYYVNARINLAKGVFILPEFGHYDLADNFAGADQGDVTYYGLKWQIDF
jgi:hypothetical protein